MKAILYMAVGALAFYLYTNPGEMDPVADKAKNLAKQGAEIVIELTDK